MDRSSSVTQERPESSGSSDLEGLMTHEPDSQLEDSKLMHRSGTGALVHAPSNNTQAVAMAVARLTMAILPNEFGDQRSPKAIRCIGGLCGCSRCLCLASEVFQVPRVRQLSGVCTVSHDKTEARPPTQNQDRRNFNPG